MREIEWIHGEEIKYTQIFFVKTLLNDYNISNEGTDCEVNITQQQFADLLPDIRPKTLCGTGKILECEAEFYFGKVAAI